MAGAKRPGPKCQGSKRPGPKCEGFNVQVDGAKTLPEHSLHDCKTSSVIVTFPEASL